MTLKVAQRKLDACERLLKGSDVRDDQDGEEILEELPSALFLRYRSALPQEILRNFDQPRCQHCGDDV